MLSALAVAIVRRRRAIMTRAASFSIPCSSAAKMESLSTTAALRRRPMPPRFPPSLSSSLGTSARSIQSLAGVDSMHSAPERHGRGVCASAQRGRARDSSPSPSSHSPSISSSPSSASSSSSLVPALTADNFPGHVPVLLAEVLDAFSALGSINLYVDGTLGAGGHASALVRRLAVAEKKRIGAVVGLDVDARARELAGRALSAAVSEAFPSGPSSSSSSNPPPPVVRILDANFRDMESALDSVSEELLPVLSPGAGAPPSPRPAAAASPPPTPPSSSSPPPPPPPPKSSKSSKRLKASAILLDLGVSSMQLDSPERGFSFAADGPLDMRLDGGGRGGDEASGRDPSSSAAAGNNSGGSFVTAATIVNTWPEADLASLFAAKEYGGERHAKLAARRIVRAREESEGGLKTTRQLALAIGRLGPPPRGGGTKGGGGNGGIHPATRVFQALRLAVNDELGALEEALPKAIELLEPGGRLAVISFHSGEDRVVKRAFLAAAGRPVPPDGDGDDELRSKGGGQTTFVSSRRALLLSPEPPPPPPPAVARLVTRRPVVAGEEECRSNPRARSAKLRVIEKL